MRLLAVDTSTEHCSAALLGVRDGVTLRCALAGRRHAELLLPMIDELLSAAGWPLADLDGLAFGRGPGGFTGLRLAAGVVQGLAFASGLRVAGVSSLAAVAFQVPGHAGQPVLVCNDARMGELYVGLYTVHEDRVVALDVERVVPPATILALAGQARHVAGNGLAAHPDLRSALVRAGLQIHDSLYPRADAVGALALREFAQGNVVMAGDVVPVYVRDDVVKARPAGTHVT